MEITLKAKLYEMKAKEITVDNPFNSDVDYQIFLNHEKPITSENKSRKKKSITRDTKRESNKIEEESVIPAFYVKGREKVIVKRNSKSQIQIQFLPFIMETQRCFLVFCDEKVGEIQYTLIGEVELPNPVEILTPPPFYLEADSTYLAPIAFKNMLLEKAKNLHYDRLTLIAKSKEKEKEAVRIKTLETIAYDIENLSQYITLPLLFTLTDMNKKAIRLQQGPAESKDNKLAKKKNPNEISFDSKLNDTMSQNGVVGFRMNDSNENKLPVGLNFKVPTRDYEAKFILKNLKKTDIRVYIIKFTIQPRPVKAIIEMVVPARGVLIQEIPIINNSEKDWSLRVSLVQDLNKNGQYLSGPRDLMVKKKSTQNYPITFKPPWILEAEAKFILSNPFTAEQYEYEIKGIGEEPLAENHIILECKAKKPKEYKFEIKNITEKIVSYRVETDLNNASGAETFKVKPNGSYKYALIVTPNLGGIYTGSITFFDEENKYIWYTVEVRTESAKAEKAIDLATNVRKAIAFDIALSNPLKDSATFEVIISGEGLLGETAFTILPGLTGTYELVFSPLKAIKSVGSIAFIHEKLGEIWYELNLIAEENPSVRLPMLKCELGKVESNEVEIENPSSKEVKVKCRISNSYNFEVTPENIIIPPYDSVIASISYMPSDLDVIEVIILNISNTQYYYYYLLEWRSCF